MTVSLAVDIGNTETAVGIFVRKGKDWKLERSVRLPTDGRATGDLLFSLLVPHLASAPGKIRVVHRVVVSSVVPPLIAAWVDLGKRILGAETLVLESLDIPGIEIRIPRPEEAGIDRIINAWMGFRRYGGPLVVVDLGTATTFDIVDDTGAYLGGIIAPGANLFAESLAQRTAKLPRIALAPPVHAIGRSTLEALQSGTVFGHAAMVEGLLSRAFDELGSRRAIATGGLAGSVRPMLDELFVSFDPSLTLEGINTIADEIAKGRSTNRARRTARRA